jgi:hypothetical protein
MKTESHYKYLKGTLTLEEVIELIGDMQLTASVRAGAIQYLVNGYTMDKTKGNTSALVKTLHTLNERKKTGNAHKYMHDFISTDKYSPRSKHEQSRLFA